MVSNENSHKGHDRGLEIARSAITSPEYGRRLSKLSESSNVQKKIIEESRKTLEHRNGTDYEDLIFIDAVTGLVRKNNSYNKSREVLPTKSMMKMIGEAEEYSVIAIHNHPSSTVPSLQDVLSLVKKKYRYGLVMCHNGAIFKYSVVGEFIDTRYITAFKKLDRSNYTDNDIDIFIAEAREAGISLEVL